MLPVKVDRDRQYEEDCYCFWIILFDCKHWHAEIQKFSSCVYYLIVELDLRLLALLYLMFKFTVLFILTFDFISEVIFLILIFSFCCYQSIWSYALVVRAQDSQSKGPRFNTTGWQQGRLSLLSFWGQSNEY